MPWLHAPTKPRFSSLRKTLTFGSLPGDARSNGPRVVDDDHLDLRIVLVGERVQARLEVGAGTARGDDHRERPSVVVRCRAWPHLTRSLPLPKAAAPPARGARDRRPRTSWLRLRRPPVARADRGLRGPRLSVLQHDPRARHRLAPVRRSGVPLPPRARAQPANGGRDRPLPGREHVPARRGLDDGIVHSYDLETRQGRAGADLDRELVEALRATGSRTASGCTADSRTADPPGADRPAVHRRRSPRGRACAQTSSAGRRSRPEGTCSSTTRSLPADFVPTRAGLPVAAQAGEEWKAATAPARSHIHAPLIGANPHPQLEGPRASRRRRRRGADRRGRPCSRRPRTQRDAVRGRGRREA